MRCPARGAGIVDAPADVAPDLGRLVAEGAQGVFGAAPDVGLSPTRVVESLTQVTPYAGLPRVLEACPSTDQVFRTGGVRTTTIRRHFLHQCRHPKMNVRGAAEFKPLNFHS